MPMQRGAVQMLSLQSDGFGFGRFNAESLDRILLRQWTRYRAGACSCRVYPVLLIAMLCSDQSCFAVKNSLHLQP